MKDVPVKSYSKAEMAALYGITTAQLKVWIQRINKRKEWQRMAHNPHAKLLTIAEVKFLFQDDVLGKP